MQGLMMGREGWGEDQGWFWVSGGLLRALMSLAARIMQWKRMRSERRDGDKFQSSQEVWLCGEERT